jgi:hypothetical protein
MPIFVATLIPPTWVFLAQLGYRRNLIAQSDKLLCYLMINYELRLVR